MIVQLRDACLRLNVDDPALPVVASEFVSTSITSDFPAALVPVAEQSNAAWAVEAGNPGVVPA